LVLVGVLFALAGPADGQQSTVRCQVGRSLSRIPDLPEASGIAVSRAPGRLWAHNDGQPLLVSLDTRGSVMARVRLTGVTILDWEALAVGRCPGGSCVYVADIGDNQARRSRVTVYRLPEPGNQSSASVREAFHATYPDGPRDAETLLVTPEGGLYVVTKGEGGPVGLYRFPRDLRPGDVHDLERIGQLQPEPARGGRRRAPPLRVTDGSVSADGQWVALRTRQALLVYAARDFFAGSFREETRLDLRGLGETQGEGVALSADGVAYLIGEGGGKGQPGTFATLSCSFS
jgi:hypothetical protein